MTNRRPRAVGLPHAQLSESARPGARAYQVTAAIAQSGTPVNAAMKRARGPVRPWWGP
jgi:hypothetical protein